MSKFNHDFDAALKKVRNRPKKTSPFREQLKRNRAEELCHLVKRFPRQSAQSNELMDTAASLTRNGDAHLILEAIEYMFKSEPSFLTYNRHFGFALEALSQHGLNSRVKEILKQSIRDYPQNIAANASMGAIFDSLIDKGHINTVAKMVSKLAVMAPEILASNPGAGWAISHLIESDKPLEGVNAFIVLSKLHPVAFSMNSTVDRAISSVEKLDLNSMLGASKGDYVGTLINNLRCLQQSPPVLGFGK